MPHGPEHHLEEAEHAQHAVHNPFDRRVALTMAIVAALLASVTMLSHRAHNGTLQNQIQSNDNITERANVFAYYQAKKNRQLLAEGLADEFALTADASGSSTTKDKAKQAVLKWTDNARKWKADAKKLEMKGHQLSQEIQKYAEEAHRHHHRANFFDLGELGIELALILCSIALLTKGRPFWFAGMVAAGLGVAVAMAGFIIPPSHEEHRGEEEEEVAWLVPVGSSGRRGGSRGGATATTSLDERVNAQSEKYRAEQHHQRQAGAAHALRPALGGQGGNEPPAGGEEAE